MYTYPHSDAAPPPNEPTLAGLLAFTAVLGATVVALSHPLATLSAGLAVGATVAVARTARTARDPGRVREIPLPGVGTLRFTVTPR
jgi:hypothetical protein